MKATTVGLDIGKSVFRGHVEDAAGRIVAQRRLRRAQVTTFFARLPASVVGIEACGSAHYWGRELQALGHEVRPIPAAYVKPFVRRNKTDARDAAAICAALRHPDMRFLGFQTGLGAWAGNPRMALKSTEQQASRGARAAGHTQLCHSVRSQLAEHGLVAAQGRRGFAQLPGVAAGRVDSLEDGLLDLVERGVVCCWDVASTALLSALSDVQLALEPTTVDIRKNSSRAFSIEVAACCIKCAHIAQSVYIWSWRLDQAA